MNLIHFPAPQAATDLPQPPFAMSNVEYVAANVVFEQDRLRSQLAEIGLRPSAGHTGGFFIYLAPTGWGMAPYSACTMWADVADYDSSDGTPGRVILGGFYSGKAYPIMRDIYRAPVEDGRSSFTSSLDGIVGEGGPPGRPVLRLALTARSGKPAVPKSGVHFYLRPLGGGSVRLSQIAHSSISNPVTVEDLRINGQQSAAFSSVPVVATTGGLHLTGMALTFGAPVEFARSGWARNDSDLVYLLGRWSRAVLMVDTELRVAYLNEAAERSLGDGLLVQRGRLRAATRGSDRLLKSALAGQGAWPGPEAAPHLVTIERPSGRKPYLVTLVPIGQAGSRRILVIVADPDAPQDLGRAEVLQTLGLTRGEARVAALIGSGLSPREAAGILGNKEATVRFNLKRVFDKLGLSRQSELAVLVTRLDLLGF